MKNFRHLALLLLFLPLLTACVTTKKKGTENSLIKRGFHNLTSKYNYWFNADELFRLTTAKMSAESQDNYSQLLSVFPYESANRDLVKTDLDNVITKASRGIALHRPSVFVDDCYTLIGQAQMLKTDFETAENTFKFIYEEHNPNKKIKTPTKKTVKKKKSVKKKSSKRKKKAAAKKRKREAKKRKKQTGSTKKTPPKTTTPKTNPTTVSLNNPYKQSWQKDAAYPLAMIWYGRTLTAREKYDEAEFLFRSLWDDPHFPESLHQELLTSQADLFIKQQQYTKAIEPLQDAIPKTKSKPYRARLAFILAQISEKAGNYNAAYAAYEQVLKNQPSYEMDFNARLKQLQAGWTNNQISSNEAIKNLEKMAADTKNTEYRDQIYFVMADIALHDNQETVAIGYLKKSLAANVNNNGQRAEAYLKLANLYFNQEMFVQAKNYFDSTLTVLPNTDKRYKSASEYAKNLKDIAKLISTIENNDSIARIYYMDPSQRRELAKILKKQKADSEAEAQKVANDSKNAAAGAPPPQAGKNSSFYFYNEAFLKKGRKDFVKVWGNRPLEDNWRRSNRPTIASVTESTNPDSTNTDGLSNSDLTDIFKSIPSNAAELAVLQMATYEALFQLGTRFRDHLNNNPKCTETLETLQSRFPDTTKYEKETWYYCYIAFKDLLNDSKVQYYYDKLVGKYPNSAHARAISDANFLNANAEKKRELEQYYAETFNAYQSGNYKTALEQCTEAPRKFGSQNPLNPKFALLSALCTGNILGNDAYCKALGDVITQFPNSPEATRAKEISRLLTCKGFEITSNNNENPDEAYTREDDKLHYFLAILKGDVKLDDVKASITDYNREKHKTEQLRISNIFLGTDTNTPIIVIRKFDTKEQSMIYYREVKNNKDFLGETKKSYNKEFFTVTQENYRRILKNKSLDAYRAFFNKEYLK
jgi:tetratricopeptide (TPR) repeat protein